MVHSIIYDRIKTLSIEMSASVGTETLDWPTHANPQTHETLRRPKRIS